MNIKSRISNIFKSSEELVSMFLGLVIVIVVVGLVYNYFQNNRGSISIPGINDQKISTGEKLNNSQGNQDNNKNEYTIVAGDSLWKIAQNYYGNGDRWIEIAKENKIENPGALVTGQKIVLPGERVQPIVPTGPIAAVSITIAPTITATPTVTILPTATNTIAPTIPTVVEPQKPTPTTGQNSGKNEYTVVAGDSLWKIAQKNYGNGNRWIDIAKENKLENPRVLVIGQKLVLVGESGQGETYTIVAGDSLWKIAVNKYNDGYKWVNIWNNNKDIVKNPNKIEIGMRLILPKL